MSGGSNKSSQGSKGSAFRQRLRERIAKLRKSPVVTPEQKLHLKLTNLKTEATNLNNRAAHLLTQTSTFSSRATSTPLPAAPPSNRDALFERHPTSGPPSNYDAQVRAHDTLVLEWREFVDTEVKAWEKDLEQFEKVVVNLRGKHFDGEKAVGEMEHEFIGLGNAIFNLKVQKTELALKVEDVKTVLDKDKNEGDGADK